jgi:two-component sensor histidine kinase
MQAQDHRADSIARLLAQLPTDSTRLATCVDRIMNEDEEIAQLYLTYGKQLATRINDLFFLAELIRAEAILANIRGEHLLGVEIFLKADSICRVLDDSLLIARAQANIGLSYYHARQYDQALKHYFEAYSIYDRREPSTEYSRLLNNLAMCLKRTDQPEEAVTYYLKSLEIKEALGDSLGYANTHHNLGLLLSTQGQLTAAITSFDTAIAIYHALGMAEDEASSNVALGKALMDNDQYERADDHLRSGYEFLKRSDSGSKEFLLAAQEMARLAMQQEQWELADQYASEALALTTDLDRVDERLMLLQLHAEILDHRGDGHGAYIAQREAMTLSDSVHSLQRLSLTEEMQTRFEVREKEKDLRITHLELEGERKLSTLYKTAWIISLAVALLIAALGVFLFRSRLEIRKKQEIIEAALKEKEMLLKEIHHRVKNNLQIISSLLGMQSYQSRDPNVSHAMREGQNRVHAMSLIHQTLYRDRNVIEVDAREYVEKLVESLRTAYRVDPERIALMTDVDPLKLDVDLMIPLGLILNELITNALKYAFPDGRKGQITIELKNEMNAILIQVQDDGVGMSDPDRLKQSQSMGYTLVTDFCAKLKATVDVRSEHGTAIEIRIPHSLPLAKAKGNS